MALQTFVDEFSEITVLIPMEKFQTKAFVKIFLNNCFEEN